MKRLKKTTKAGVTRGRFLFFFRGRGLLFLLDCGSYEMYLKKKSRESGNNKRAGGGGVGGGLWQLERIVTPR